MSSYSESITDGHQYTEAELYELRIKRKKLHAKQATRSRAAPIPYGGFTDAFIAEDLYPSGTLSVSDMVLDSDLDGNMTDLPTEFSEDRESTVEEAPDEPLLLRLTRTFRAAFIILIFTFIGIGIFCYVESLSTIDSSFFTVVTFTTLGYGANIWPRTGLGQVVVVFFGVAGLGAFGYVIQLISDASNKKMAAVMQRVALPRPAADPFVRLSFADQGCWRRTFHKAPHTSVIPNTLNPRWIPEPWTIDLYYHPENITVEVWDWDRTSGNDMIGYVTLPVDKIPKGNYPAVRFRMDPADEEHDVSAARVFLGINRYIVARDDGESHEVVELSVLGCSRLPVMDELIGAATLQKTIDNSKEMVLVSGLLLSVLVVGGVMFSLIEGWRFYDAFYFTLITVTTIGYGDFSPVTPLGRGLWCPFAIIALGIGGYAINVVQNLTMGKATHSFLKRKNKADDREDDDWEITVKCKAFWSTKKGGLIAQLLFTLLVTIFLLFLGSIVLINEPGIGEGTGGERWFTKLYFCTVTVTTVGYGDYSPSTDEAKFFIMIYAVLGLGVISYTISVISKASVETMMKGFDELSLELPTQTDTETDSDYDSSESSESDPWGQKRKDSEFSSSGGTMRLSAYTSSESSASSETSVVISMDVGSTDESDKPTFCQNLTHSATFQLIVSILAFVVLNIFGAACFYSIEPDTFDGDFAVAIYFCVVTLTTIGFGDYYPLTIGGQLFFMVFIFMGLALFAFTLSALTAASAEILQQTLARARHGTAEASDVIAARKSERARRLREGHRVGPRIARGNNKYAV